jgi:hypothetical protein
MKSINTFSKVFFNKIKNSVTDSLKEAAAIAEEKRVIDQLDSRDGFIYIASLREYGSVSTHQYYNTFVLQAMCDEYYGDNGIVDIITNNPDHGICNEGGDVEVMSAKQIFNACIDSLVTKRIEAEERENQEKLNKQNKRDAHIDEIVAKSKK